MGNAVEKYVKSSFGPTCGSAELRALREEYLEKARAAYDRELASGATERQANDRALAAISDMERVLWEKDIPKKQNRWKTCIAIVFFSAVALLLFGKIFLTHRDPHSVFNALKGAAITLGLLAFGTICLLRKTWIKFIPIFCLVLGSVLLLFLLQHLDVRHYDYRDQLDRIQSVELIELTKTADGGVIHEDELEYRALRSIDPAEWEALIDDVARLDYHFFFPNPRWWSGDPVRLLIRFTPGEDGLCLAIIGESPAIGTEKGSRVEIRAASSSTNGWEALAEKYDLAMEP
jgi:hypothetical protein